jgi:hypothetical protein
VASYRGSGVGDAAKRLNSILPAAAQLSAADFDLNICRFHAIAFLVHRCFELKTPKANMHAAFKRLRVKSLHDETANFQTRESEDWSTNSDNSAAHGKSTAVKVRSRG